MQYRDERDAYRHDQADLDQFEDEHMAGQMHQPSPRRSRHVPGSHQPPAIDATPGSLVRVTLGAMAAAGAILTLFWLPAEYGIDPTGVGGVLGLADMGEIKQQLFAEAAAEDLALAEQALSSAPANAELALRLEAIEARLTEIAATLATETPAVAEPAAVMPDTPVLQPPAVPEWFDEVTYTLDPGEGVEIKLVMAEGAIAEFEWTANGAVLNHDTHGSGGGQSITYAEGRGVPGEQGELVAAFPGNHGWFWRNRTEAPVTFTLRTRGDYTDIILP